VAFAAVGVLILIVATGATVRLTGSGLGCPEWPTCTTKHALPQSYHSYIEFSNRVVSAITVFTTVALAVAAWLTRGLSRRGKWLATAVGVGVIAQAPFGAIVVYYDLNPYLVISHLLLTMIVLGLAVLVLLEAARLVRGSAPALPALARAGSVALLVAVSVLVVSGTVATAAGRFPGNNGTDGMCVRSPRSGSCSSCSQAGPGSSAPASPGWSAAAWGCWRSSSCRWGSARRSTAPMAACRGGWS
jgi:heme a synthase